MDKIFIVANWKCNPLTLEEAKALLSGIKQRIKNIKKSAFNKIEIVICPPFIYLACFLKTGPYIKIGGQNCFWQNSVGAFTGEISPLMLKKMGLKYVIIGHSERRKLHKETDLLVNKKIKAALASGLRPIVCIASLAQLKNSLKGIDKTRDLIIAYEPLFAIGTGKACSVERAKKYRQKINFSQVLYGGSVKAENALDYVKKAGFQGLLIGGASLKDKEFAKIIKRFA